MNRPPKKQSAKPTPAAAPKSSGGKTAGNTPATTYLDTFNTNALCAKDKQDIIDNCKPLPDKEKAEVRGRQTGLRRHIRKVTSRLDGVGQKAYSYNKGTPAGNEWMDDYCDGMWIKPQFNSTKDFQKEINDFKGDLNKLGDTVESYMQHPDKIIKAGFENLARDAVDKLGYENVRNMMLRKFGTDALLAAIPFKAGMATKLATIGKSGISSAGYLNSADHLAAALNTPQSKELLSEMKFMVSKAKDRLEELTKVWKDKPDAVMAELMTLNSEIDPCLKARKCQLVPYKENDKDNLKKGNGCCPGQTGHHVIPDSAVKDAGCEKYKYNEAPTICLEGQDNSFGSHGRAHKNLDDSINDYNGPPRSPPKPISYTDMREKALDAIKDSTEQCNRLCLQAQLDAYYKNCGDLTAKSGKGGAIPKEPPSQDKPESIPDKTE